MKYSNFFNSAFLLFIALLCLSFFLLANNNRPVEQDTKIKWVTLEEAQQLSQQEPKKVFIDVYTSWCGPCKLMDKTTFNDINVANYVNSNYYAVKLNAESTQIVNYKGSKISERELAKSFEVKGYPTIVLIDENFEGTTSKLGYMRANQFKELLMQFNGEE